MSRIDFIGLGIMGGPMAGHLQAGGHELYLVKHRSALPQAPIDGGARECVSCKEVAERADIVVIMVPDTPDVATVLFSELGVAAGLSASKTVIDMSSISPIETKDFATRINALGCDYVDAPVGARALDLSLRNTAGAQELLNACAAHGWEELDHSTMVRALEVAANHAIE